MAIGERHIDDLTLRSIECDICDQGLLWSHLKYIDPSLACLLVLTLFAGTKITKEAPWYLL